MLRGQPASDDPWRMDIASVTHLSGWAGYDGLVDIGHPAALRLQMLQRVSRDYRS
jgi:hypothetical protein